MAKKTRRESGVKKHPPKQKPDLWRDWYAISGARPAEDAPEWFMRAVALRRSSRSV
jgi:hypothetical protein